MCNKFLNARRHCTKEIFHAHAVVHCEYVYIYLQMLIMLMLYLLKQFFNLRN